MIYAASKRFIDIAAAVLGLSLAAAPLACLLLAIRLTSPGPALFTQRRVGRHEKAFTLYKLRTMARDTPNKPTHEISDTNLTPLGRILRRTKIDELPQLYNVLLGDMSLVGPRPCLTTQAELINERRRRGVFAIRPGMTGLAQVKGIDMRDAKRLTRVDAVYVRSPSLARDVALILATLFTRLRT